jgi:hypothetical protein
LADKTGVQATTYHILRTKVGEHEIGNL